MTDSIESPFLSDIEREKIALFNEDSILREAVKKVLLKGIYENGTLRAGKPADPLQNFALAIAFDPQYSNEQLGADLRASASGISLLEQGFKKLLEFKRVTPKAEEPGVNPGM